MAPEQLAVTEPMVNGVGMILVPVPAGEFLMGSAPPPSKDGKPPEDVPGAESERPQHQVRISKSFVIGAYEVTQSQYEQVMGESPWKGQPLTTTGATVAASYVSWDKAMEFCKKLSEKENASYRLPTEAEWEYACRAGTTTPYSFDHEADKLNDYAWFDQNAYKDGEQYAHAAGQKLPNSWSLHDMHGNVWEWCSDFHSSYSEELEQSNSDTLVDPKGPEKGGQHVWRGGGFSENGVNLRSACRNSYGRPDYRPEFMAGFRVVKELQ